MYIPAHFREKEVSELHTMMRQNSFAAFVTVKAGVPFATHLPVLLNTESPPFGTLRGHVARSNPQWGDFEAGTEALLIFGGPHAYISPSWYEMQPSVPTWNYTAVHAYGVPRILSDTELKTLLFDLTAFHEANMASPWQPADLPDDYVEKMVRAIVGFEVVITRLEGKCKLSQNRSETDRQNVIAALRQSGSPEDATLADAMEK